MRYHRIGKRVKIKPVHFTELCTILEYEEPLSMQDGDLLKQKITISKDTISGTATLWVRLKKE